MADYKTIAESKKFIVLDKYTKCPQVNEAYQSEYNLEREFINDLENQGYDVKGPRDAIKLAFQIDLINNGHKKIGSADHRGAIAQIIYRRVVATVMTNQQARIIGSTFAQTVGGVTAVIAPPYSDPEAIASKIRYNSKASQRP